jgi:hypothetical protein
MATPPVPAEVNTMLSPSSLQVLSPASLQVMSPSTWDTTVQSQRPRVIGSSTLAPAPAPAPAPVTADLQDLFGPGEVPRRARAAAVPS